MKGTSSEKVGEKNYLLTSSLHDEPFKQPLCLSWTALERNGSISIELPKAAGAFRATVRVLRRGWRGILCAAEYIKNDPFKSDT